MKLSQQFYVSETDVTAAQFDVFRADYQNTGPYAPYATGIS